MFEFQTAFLYDEISHEELSFALYDLFYYAEDKVVSLDFDSPWEGTKYVKEEIKKDKIKDKWCLNKLKLWI